MTRRIAFHIALSALLTVACCCGARRNVGEKEIPASDLRVGKSQDPALVNLTRMYQAAQDQFARRAVCLRAIDEGAIRRGVHIRSVDQIFGTDLEAEWGARKLDGKRVGVVHFVPDVDAPRSARSDRKTEGRGFFGWFLGVDYDDSGVVQNYDLSNIHKGDSHGELGRTPSPIAELKERYAAAKSESERREIGLRAIDEGVVKTYGPVSTIDELFGTHMVSQLPTKKEGKRIGVVNFVSPVPISPSPEVKAEAAGQDRWFMAVEYDYNGNLKNYFLTNTQK